MICSDVEQMGVKSNEGQPVDLRHMPSSEMDAQEFKEGIYPRKSIELYLHGSLNHHYLDCKYLLRRSRTWASGCMSL